MDNRERIASPLRRFSRSEKARREKLQRLKSVLLWEQMSN
jgi:hypothetical protein